MMLTNACEQNKYQYRPGELARLQQIELEMLIEVDRICKKHNIAYELDGGTLLGAIRHKGFIPWDDDIDIRMMQTEYERFRKACGADLDHERFFLQDYTTDPNYRWGYGKLLLKNTRFERYHQEMLTMRRGIFLDIFNCVGMPEQGIKKRWFNFRCFLLRKAGYAPIGAKYDKNVLYRFLYRVMRLIPLEKIRAGFEKINHEFDGKDTKYVRTPGWYYRQEDQGYLRRWMNERTGVTFEGHVFPAPRDYDGYLKQLYGDDYMTPPPVEKQVPENDAYLIDFGREQNE